MAKSSGCSSRGPGFDNQYPHDSSQSSITPLQEDLKSGAFLWSLQAAGMQVVKRHTCR